MMIENIDINENILFPAGDLKEILKEIKQMILDLRERLTELELSNLAEVK